MHPHHQSGRWLSYHPNQLIMKITTTLKSIAHIEAEAVKAAQKYTSINDACPYPFGSTSARIFRLAFAKALAKSIITPPVRERMNAARGNSSMPVSA